MFTAVGLFHDVSCPEQSQCVLPNCIFAHDVLSSTTASIPLKNGDSADDNAALDSSDAPRKRRRLGGGVSPQPRSDLDHGQLRTPSATPNSIARLISPPPLRQKSFSSQRVDHVPKESKSFSSNSAAISLNPRMLANPPASHGIRIQLIKLLHEQLHRLNDEIRHNNDPSQRSLLLSNDEVILQALDEEESRAKGNATVYANVVKLRIGKLKKMKFSEWKQERLERVAKETVSKAESKAAPPRDIITGLQPKQEIAFLSRLLAKQDGLEKHGYVVTKFSQNDIEQVRTGLEAAHGWEQCDRCKTRFQVFPGRRDEDGALTSGGACTYHPAKPRRPTATDKADKITKDLSYACCKENLGVSVGCTKAPSHVFKISDQKRLDLVMPFMRTPDNPAVGSEHTAVCFDCEMGYTTQGLELIRLTATDWPSGRELLDVLVRPLGEILDLNSQFSGVWPNDFAKASPYEQEPNADLSIDKDSKPCSFNLKMVNSPYKARELLFSHLDTSTPLIGHALDNDLNASRIIHPSIVDSVLLYPHPKGLPIRYGLKMLTKRYLNRDIQMGDGAAGHDSKEDARAAGELVKWKVKESWERMKRDGWTVEGQEFVAPMSRADVMRRSIATIKGGAAAP